MSELTVLLELVKQHIDDDSRRFDEQNGKLDEIRADVKSLLESRSYKAGRASIISAIVSAIVAFIVGRMH